MLDNQKVDISVELSGSVEDVIYKNADNGYTVINLGCDEGLIAVVGNLGDVNEGERLSLRGGWITSPKYGRQFKAAMCERSMPETESEISAYLGSGYKRARPRHSKENSKAVRYGSTGYNR